MKTKTLFLFAIAALLFMFPVNALACACCSESDYYFSGPTDLDEYPLSQLKRMRFDRTANLFFSEAGIEEHSKGIAYVRENYSFSPGSPLNNMWKFSFRSGTNSGMLGLLLPAKLWDHDVDIHDNKVSAGGGPLLYKEWRLEGEVAGTGIFKVGFSAPAKYRLVLQGRGNACDNAEDFTNWRLEVRGEGADYAFYGKLLKPTPQR